jgi:hypothetical protein
LSCFSKGFCKNKSRPSSASVLVSIKYFFVSAVVFAQSKVRLFSAGVQVRIKFLGFGKKQSCR